MFSFIFLFKHTTQLSFYTPPQTTQSNFSLCFFSQNYTKVSDNYFSKLENSLAGTTNY